MGVQQTTWRAAAEAALPGEQHRAMIVYADAAGLVAWAVVAMAAVGGARLFQPPSLEWMALTWLAIAVMFRNGALVLTDQRVLVFRTLWGHAPRLMKVFDRADITKIESKRWHIGGRRLTLTTSTGRVRIFVHRFTRPDQVDAFIEAFATPVV